MSRDGLGIYSPPAGTTATAGTPIESAKYNAFVADLVADANLARPIVAGGTGATTAGAALTALGGLAATTSLTALGGLTPAADRLPYFTGASTAALATLTAAGRAILDDADAAAQRTTLGLGALATAANITTAEIAAATLVTEAEGISSNDNDTTIPTSAAVKDYVDTNAGTGFEYAWHPYNKTTLADSDTGRIWSFAVDGAVTTITTPDFEDGWEYAVYFETILTSGASSNLTINAYRATTAAYAGATNLVAVDNTFPAFGWVEFSKARRTLRQHSLFGNARANPSGANSVAAFATTQLVGQQVYHASAEKLLRVQFALSAAGNITGSGAAMYLYRRKDVA